MKSRKKMHHVGNYFAIFSKCHGKQIGSFIILPSLCTTHKLQVCKKSRTAVY